MQHVIVFVAGIAVGYTLHNRRDQTVGKVAGGVADFLENRVASTLRSASRSV